ncbi:MAG: aldehyde dehydrogenase [Chloroflexi bacterium]|nr:MAG: aldehyde dehydrogenase [Chloroflexota bacterium]
MSVTIRQGSPQFPAVTGSIPSSTHETMDAAVHTLQEHKDAWVALSNRQRIAILDNLINNFAAIAQLWIAASLQAKGIAGDSPGVGEEWVPPRIPGPVTTRPDGQVVAQVFPQTTYDRLFFLGVTAEIWMEPGVTAEELPKTQAIAYQEQKHGGKVALVLGAGNVASIGPLDILYKLFVEDQVVIFKTNPVNAYLGPLIEESFRTLIEQGFLQVVYGGAVEGAYLCNHPGVEEIHITGSDKTFDAIVFGTGEEGARRKAERQPVLNKRITGELGNVSPVIVVPGPWSVGDLAYQAEHIASMLTNNAGFNCNATRVVVQHREWEQRDQLLQHMRNILAQVPTRIAYYPGAHNRYQAFVSAHPEAEQFGTTTEKELPWTLIAGVNPDATDDLCFTTEAFCSLFAETNIDAASVPEYIDRAVDLANKHHWGTLNATIIVHPTSLKDPAVAAAVERAVANLRYGTIGVNYWAGTGFVLCVTTWGAFPGHEMHDIQSGVGVVHNTLMFSRPQKSVLRAPFRSSPTPPWFVTRGKTARKVFPKLVDLEVSPSPWKVPGILWSAITG